LARPLVTLVVVALGAAGLIGTVLLRTELDRARTWWADRFEGSFIEVYLAPSVTDDEAMALGEQLETDFRLQRATYISAAAAQEEAETYLGALTFSVLAENPLPASIRLEIALESRSPEAVQQLTDSLAGIPGLTEIISPDRQITIYAQGASIIVDYTNMLIAGSLCWTAFSLFFGVFLIGRVRAPVWRIWRYLGARPGWFRWPLMAEGAILGFCCSVAGGLYLRLTVSGEWFATGLPLGLASGFLPWLAAPALIGALAGWLAYRVHRRHSMTF
ncbi:cell division protein FtsX, partial [Candidatus Zixiibacteriota bacterium]